MKKEEFEYILAFIKEAGDISTESIIVNQVIALWTAFCLHYNVTVDTYDYDWRVMEIARTIGIEYKDLNRFYNKISQYLV